MNFQFYFCVWLHCSMHWTLTTYLTTDCSRHHHVMAQQQMWRYRQGQIRCVLNLHEAVHASTKNNSSHFRLPDWSCPFVRQQWMTSWGTADIVSKCPCQSVKNPWKVSLRINRIAVTLNEISEWSRLISMLWLRVWGWNLWRQWTGVVDVNECEVWLNLEHLFWPFWPFSASAIVRYIMSRGNIT